MLITPFKHSKHPVGAVRKDNALRARIGKLICPFCRKQHFKRITLEECRLEVSKYGKPELRAAFERFLSFWMERAQKRLDKANKV